MQGQRREAMGSDIYTAEKTAPILHPQRCPPSCSGDVSAKDIFPHGSGLLPL